MAQEVKEREPLLMCVTGKKGVGKTYQTLHLIADYVRDDLSVGQKGRKVLIFDTNGEYTDESIKRCGLNFTIPKIALKDVAAYSRLNKIEVRRVNGATMDLNQKIEALSTIMDSFRGGLLVIEDINSYLLSVTHQSKILGIICTVRHRDLDVIAHFQSLKPLEPRMWQNTNVIRFHKQSDKLNDSAYKNKIANFELMAIAANIVDNKFKKGDQRFFLYVYLSDDYIQGNFSKKEFEEACRDYFLQNPSIIKQEVLKLGLKKADNEKAIKSLTQDIYSYYGNDRNA